jgi:hypothetical protein
MVQGLRDRSIMPTLVLLVMTSFLWAVSCKGARARSDNIPNQSNASRQNLMDYVGLLDKLRAKGLKAERGDEIAQPFFSVKGKTISADGESLQVFEYANESDAEAQAKLVDLRGDSVGTTMVNWVDDPHFYRGGKLIVLYVGTNQDVIKALEDVLGPQFAGRQ